MLSAFATVWGWLAGVGGVGAAIGGGVALFAGFRAKAIAITAGVGLLAALAIAATFYAKGYSAANAACEARALRDALAAEKAVSADLRDQIAARDEIARRAQERAVSATLDREQADEQIEALRVRLRGIEISRGEGGQVICADAETARMLDEIGR